MTVETKGLSELGMFLESWPNFFFKVEESVRSLGGIEVVNLKPTGKG